MIGFCSIQNIRDRNTKLTLANFSDADVTTQIENAENTILADLSKLYSSSDLTAAVGSSTLKELAVYKTMESALVFKFGNTRQADETTDVDYWARKYSELLAKILDGSVIIEVSGTDYTPVNIPKITSGVTKIFTTRGIDGFEDEYDSNENDVITGAN